MAATKTKLTWHTQEVAELALTVGAIDGAGGSAGSAGGITYWMQTHGPLQIGVWVGDGQNLTAWRARFAAPRQASFAAETLDTVCAAPAARQEANVEADPEATGAFYSADGTLEHRTAGNPPQVSAGLAFRHNGNDYLVSWTIAADQRADYAADERHFFASLACK